jgi:hypothetical protein
MKYWYDITYPTIFDNRLMQWVWKKAFCPTGWHLFDEVSSSYISPKTGKWEHTLYCDACELDVELVD